ncbi:MAG: hypothetical protein AABZ47_05050 [Planctomycetota bacterium]
MMNRHFNNRTPQERDRTMQVHLAQARGTRRNGDLLRHSIDVMLNIRANKSESKDSTMTENVLIETLSAVVLALESESVPYAVTGSIASSVHGEPITSLDVDLIVHASRSQAANLSEKLQPRFYASADVLAEAADRFTLINVIDNRTSFKVDLSFVPPTGYLREVLSRRVRQRIGSTGPEFWFVTPEDIILMKLLWRKDTGSAKQWDNALGVARVRGARMDWKYLFDTARELGIEGDLIKLRDEAGI